MGMDPEGTILAGGTEGAGTTGKPEGTEGQGTTGGKGNEGSGAKGGKPESIGWKAALKAELRDHEAFKDVKDVNDLAVRFIDINGRAQGAIKKPGDNATKEELDAYYQALGRPKTKDGYRFDATKLPEPLRQDADFTGWLQDTVFDAGLTESQAAIVQEKLGQRLQAGIERSKVFEQQQQQTLRKETDTFITTTFGAEAPNRVKVVNNTLNAVGNLIGMDLRPIMREGRTGNKLWVFKIFNWIAEKILPDGAPPQGAGAAATGDGKPSMRYPQLKTWLGNR